MRCPRCDTNSKVVWSRERQHAGKRRRRECTNSRCGHRWSTEETGWSTEETTLVPNPADRRETK